MHLQLLKGNFSRDEALDLLAQLIHVKIKFHEGKIEKSHNEEDIKMRERRIKELQHDLFKAREFIMAGGKYCELEADFRIS